jgi:hypothetical protein
MTRHIDNGELQDFLEGLLDPEVEGDVREHLDSCAHCRQELEGLAGLREMLGELPLEADPGRDLWPQIGWRIEGTKAREPGFREGSSTVEALDQAPSPASIGAGRKISLPAWQLLAASIALMVISGATVWALLGPNPGVMAPVGPIPESQAQMASIQEVYGGYEEAVADLETVLERGREVLDPETVRVLEENLRTIDLAIQEAQDALMSDPASAVLQRFLADNLRKKVDLLRRAAGAVYAIT